MDKRHHTWLSCNEITGVTALNPHDIKQTVQSDKYKKYKIYLKKE